MPATKNAPVEQQDTPAVEAPEQVETPAVETPREIKVREASEAADKARAEALENGDLLIVPQTVTVSGKELEYDLEFSVTDKTCQTHERITKVTDIYRTSDVPLVFDSVARSVGEKYPEDLIQAMYVLEDLGLVRRMKSRRVGSESQRGATAFQWINESQENSDAA